MARWWLGFHFEFQHAGMRVRTDFFTRPPRVPPVELERMWREQEGRDPPFTDALVLLRMKQTARKMDGPVIGELARTLSSPREQILHSRSAHDLLALRTSHPELCRELAGERPAPRAIGQGLPALRLAPGEERFAAMDADDRRSRSYLDASRALAAEWPSLQARSVGIPLRQFHERLATLARACLPTTPDGLRPEIGP